MSKIKLAVVGGGQMGRALVGGMLASQIVQETSIHLVEPSQISQSWWAEQHPGVNISELETAVAASEVVLLAVKPNVMGSVAQQTQDFWQNKLVVSIAAGISLDQLCGWVGHRRVIRVMPNTPSLVRAGASGYSCGQETTEHDRTTIQSILESVGLAVEVEEHQLEGVTGLSGSGPAYVCLVIEALADGGVLAGLPRPLAMQLATQTVLGTAEMVAKTGQHPGQLKDAVASPGGTTIAAISVLEQNGLRGALIEAVAASANRSRLLGRLEE